MNSAVPFLELANLCRKLEETSKRTEKTRLISSFLKSLAHEEIAAATHFIVGRAFPESDHRVLEVSGRTIWKLIKKTRQTPLVQAPLTIMRVYRYFEEIAAISGKGSRMRKEGLVESLLAEASPIESECLIRILLGEMRIGVVEGVMLDAISEASGVENELVRRSHMLLGDIGQVSRIALTQGKEALRRIGIQLFNPIKPMLAEMSYDIKEVISEHAGETGFEYKFDGARIQIHKDGNKIRVFSRRLTDVTQSLPDIVELVGERITARQALLEGEVVAIGEGGRPLPFQDLMRRFRRVHAITEMVREIPLRLYIFDILLLDGESLIDTRYDERWKILSRVCPKDLLARRIVTGDPVQAQAFLNDAAREGHEGLMAKDLSSHYMPGVRGKKWFKIKPAEHLDAVIVAADWGYGRRTGWLSNYHLAVRDEDKNEFLVVGKTFKGLTDEEFTEMTRKLQQIKVSEDEHTVYVQPRIVVEVAYNEVQKSPHYRSGFALRFARITRIREDKSQQDADTIARLRTLYEKQFEQKAKAKP